MNTKNILCMALAVGLLSGCVSEKENAKHRANVSKADAEKAAMAQVPNGTIKEAELEKEHGKLIWSFDMATPGTRDITEVHVDAKTGAVIAVSKESLEQENKEATQEKDDD